MHNFGEKKYIVTIFQNYICDICYIVNIIPKHLEHPQNPAVPGTQYKYRRLR